MHPSPKVPLDCIIFILLLDSSCGSGNFLTESYISLRRLENDILKEIHGSNMMLDFGENFNPIKVSIGQFYGIEINDFAVTVSKTALWIAESQAMQETENIVHKNLDFLPLKSYTNIIEGNALYMDWGSVVPKEQLNYIIGIISSIISSGIRSKQGKPFFSSQLYLAKAA